MSVKVPDEQENYKGPVAIFHILSNVGNSYTCYSHQVSNNNVQLPVMSRHVKYSQCIQSDLIFCLELMLQRELSTFFFITEFVLPITLVIYYKTSPNVKGLIYRLFSYPSFFSSPSEFMACWSLHKWQLSDSKKELRL